MVDQGDIQHIIQVLPQPLSRLCDDPLPKHDMFHRHILDQHLEFGAGVRCREGEYLIHRL